MGFWQKRKAEKLERDIHRIPDLSNETNRALTSKEKKIIIKVVQDTKKQLASIKKIVTDTVEDKEIIIGMLLDIQEIIDIEDEETNKPYTRKDYEKMSVSELTMTLEGAMTHLEKNI